VTTPTYNWHQFTRRITIKAPSKAIYEAWTTQQGLESWFLRQAKFFANSNVIPRPRQQQIQAGDRYEWLWHGYDDSVIEKNEILEVNGWDKLSFSFSGGCKVQVSIRQENGETLCELVQQMPLEDEQQQQYFYIECGKGWTFYLANLKSILEGGIDLRNKNHLITEVVNA
jgi:uncharacterized protein YndB with AHSA1/START domain